MDDRDYRIGCSGYIGGFIGLFILLSVLSIPFRGCQACDSRDYFEQYDARNSSADPIPPGPLDPGYSGERTRGQKRALALMAWKSVYSMAPCTDTLHEIRRSEDVLGWDILVKAHGETFPISIYEAYPANLAGMVNQELEQGYRRTGRKQLSVREAFGCP